jgi:hypothetical protein
VSTGGVQITWICTPGLITTKVLMTTPERRLGARYSNSLLSRRRG